MPVDQNETPVEGEKKISIIPGGAVSANTPRRESSDRSLFVYTIVAIAIALFIRFFVAAPYMVSGPSMEETFHNHDYLIIDRLSYRLETPQRSDVVVFKRPDGSDTLIKRVVGLPGETVTLRGTGVVIVNAENPKGLTLSEPYVTSDNEGGPSNMTITLAPDHYFVMGDNRKVSYDSRSWGTLPRENIVGRVLVRLYPFSDIGFLPGEARYQ